jgi:hypothetical protein
MWTFLSGTVLACGARRTLLITSLIAMLNFRLFRSGPAAPRVPSPGGTGDGGLLAFASESHPVVTATRTATIAPGTRARIAIVALGAVVALQALPTFLWLKNRFAPDSGVLAAAAAPGLPPGFVPVAPCVASGAEALDDAVPAPAPVGTSATPAPVPASMVAGLLAVAAPVPMHVYRDGRLIGTTEAETIMLPAGTHDLLFENVDVGYRVRRSVTVQAGRRSSTRIEAPNGTLSINAVPWAEVWVDKERVGDTPIGNLQAAVGQREVVFRHPQLGERRTTVLVTLKGPVRVSMDMRVK